MPSKSTPSRNGKAGTSKTLVFPAGFQNQEELLDAVEKLVGHSFKDRSLLLSALTHASGADSRVVSNERLEFLGDAVLGVVICEQLYRRFPNLLEGDLTKIKSVVVSRRTCARISRNLEFDRYLILGRGMTTQANVPSSVMAAVFEALIGAIFVDAGLDSAKNFVLAHAIDEIERAAGGHHGGNYKSLLQQMSQKMFGAVPVYHTVGESGPDHSKSFRVSAVLGTQVFPPAWGMNKKDAEQRAALNALCQMEGKELPFAEDDRTSSTASSHD